MSFDFPASPATGALYKPAGGPVYRFDGTVWEVAQPASNNAFIQDTPPTSPAPVHGQLWWESDTGALYVYFNDGNSSQWVQVNGLSMGAASPPNDGNEYVLVNGVWRLKHQTFVPGSTSLVIPVPPTAKHAKIYGRVVWTGGTGMQLAMRMSSDGVNFPAAAADYVYGGQQLVTGSSGSPIKIALATGGTIPITPNAYSDTSGFPVMFDGHVAVNRLSSMSGGFMVNFVGYNYHSAATALAQNTLSVGYNNGGHAGIAQLAALQFVNLLTGTFLPQSIFAVDWVY